MNNVPPEKYYEACITYHLVNEFYDRFNLRLYPFSISQIEEYDEGYDFGYRFSENSFVLQYKRPYAYRDNQCYWKIEREQLVTLNRNNLKSYYALPAFVDSMDWYTGIDNCYFVKTENIFDYLKIKTNKINSVGQSCKILKKWDMFLHRFDENTKNVAYATEESYILFHDILQFAHQVPKEFKNTTWIYLLKE